MSDKGVLQFTPTPPRPQGGAPASSSAPSGKAMLVPSWQRARDLSCSALLAGEMCVVVTGLPGTGKTVLVDTVARALRSTGWNIVTYAARLPSNAELAELTGSAAILIDDADRLSATELRTLNRLRQCSVLLAGAVGLEKRCPADSRVTLAPLPLEEVGTYVELWLEQAELSPDLVTEAVVAHLCDVSAGIPRLLDILLADSLKRARADGSEQIEEHHIDNAAWRHVEHTAARRLNRAAATPAAAPPGARPAPSRPNAALETRLAQAPFAESPAVDDRPPLVSARALGLVGLGLAIGLGTAAGVLTFPQWSPWLASAYTSITKPAERPAPAPAAAVPSAEPPRTATVERASPAPVVPPTPVVTATPQPGAETAEAPPPQSAPAPVPAAPVPVASIPTPVAPDTVAPHAAAPKVAPPLPATAAPEPLSPAVITLLNQRGQQMVDLNDYSAARLLFSRAAEAGSVTAMLALGRSYDPLVVGSLASVAGVDPAQAAQWYKRAASLGSSEAGILLQRLERSARE